MALGTWTSVVNATNAAGTVIGTGSATAVVGNGSTTDVSITVSPVPGMGSLALAITWPEGQVSSPSISATLTPALGNAQTIPFEVVGTYASYADPALTNGYYTFAFTLYSDGKTFTWYVNGAVVGTGATYTFIAHKLGYYRLDAIAVSSDGTKTGSATMSIQVNPAAGPAAVALGTARNLALLAQSGITIGAVPASITGDIGLDMISTGLAGFSQVLDGSGAFSTSVPGSLLLGRAYAASYSGTTPAMLATATTDFQRDAAGWSV